MARKRDKEIRIVFNDGKVLRIPKLHIKEIVMPGILIRNNHFKLRLDFENYEENLRKYKRKFGKLLGTR